MTSSNPWPEPTEPSAPIYRPPGTVPVPPTSGLAGFAPPTAQPPPVGSPPSFADPSERATSAQRILAFVLAVVTAGLLVADGVLEELFSFDIEVAVINLVSPVALVVMALVALVPGSRPRLGGLLLGLGSAVLCFDVGSRLAFLVPSVRAETIAVGLAVVLCVVMFGLGAVWAKPRPELVATVPLAVVGGLLVAVGRFWLEWQFGFQVDATLSFAVLYGVGGPLVAALAALLSRSGALLMAGGYGVVLTLSELWLWASFDAPAGELVALAVILTGFGLMALTGVIRRLAATS